jgi:hypothetical protein
MLEWLASREWDLFALLPPIFALLLSLVFEPVIETLLSNRLREFLQGQQNADLFNIVDAVARDRSLQIAYVSTVTSFIVSVVSVAKTNHAAVLVAILLVMGSGGGFVLTLKIFMLPPGHNTLTTWRNVITYADLYNRVLIAMNLVIIGVIIATFPKVH